MKYIKETDIRRFTAKVSDLKDVHFHGGVVVKNGEFIQFYFERPSCDAEIEVEKGVARVKPKRSRK